MNQWKDKVAVITGAASGIGSGLARYAASHGMHVVVADVATQGHDALSETLGAKGQAITTVVTDVSSPEAVENLAETAFDHYGKVNLLFNMVADSVARSLSPDKFAAKVFAGIEADKFWLLPQADFKPMFQLRVNSILDENNPLSTEEMLNQKYAGQNHDN